MFSLDPTRTTLRLVFPWLLTCCIACSGTREDPTKASTPGAAGATGLSDEPLTIHIAGDSTAAVFAPTDPTGRVGWGTNLEDQFDETVHVIDSAASGRSSKSFIDEGFWDTIKARLKADDYVFIQFGHNDEKVEDPARGTDPATTFRDFLKIYVEETRALDAHPVLLTPISRRNFTSSGVSNTHGEYPAAVVAVAEETKTPLIDMTEKTRVWLEELGPVDSIDYFASDDNTHLNTQGAMAVAELVAEGVDEIELPLAARLLP